MKIVNVIGGLGNQMFQCAFALALQNAHPEEDVKLDVSHFNGYGLHNGFEVSRVFPDFPLHIASKTDIQKVSRYIPNYRWSRLARRFFPDKSSEYIQPYTDSYIYSSNPLVLDGDRYFEGYWMCPAYFDLCKNDVIKAYTFPPFDTEDNLKYEKQLKGENSVTLHIRRGDYVGAKSFKDICTLSYYRNAIEMVKKKVVTPVFFIFSNDQQWCVENLKQEFGDFEVNFISCNKGRDSYRDMQLMSLAKCNILANSSFSWWGAYLNQRKDHLVLCPNKWVNSMEHTDHYVKGWIKINIQ